MILFAFAYLSLTTNVLWLQLFRDLEYSVFAKVDVLASALEFFLQCLVQIQVIKGIGIPPYQVHAELIGIVFIEFCDERQWEIFEGNYDA